MKTSTSRTTRIPESRADFSLRFSKAKVLAQKLGVCPRTIFRWADDGKLARHKINARVVLFDESEVLALIEAARVDSGNARAG
jgi:predicted DNA-binding transcriptional regulator AlpA